MSYINHLEIKNKIRTLTNNNVSLRVLDDIKQHLEQYPLEELEDFYQKSLRLELSKLNSYFTKQLLDIIQIRKSHYIRSNYDNVLSIKLVLPIHCNAKCEFCYLRKEEHNLAFNKKQFLDNFISSLREVISKNYGKAMSLDISGVGEPTFNLKFLKKVVDKLKESDIIKNFIRVTFTTNGYKLKEALPIIADIVNYVNISIHNIDENKRKEIFHTNTTPNNEELDNLILTSYNLYNIKVSSVFVIDRLSCEDFYKINDWCIDKGFYTNRIRFNVYEPTTFKKRVSKLLVEECRTLDNNLSVVYGENEIESSYYITLYKNNLLCYIFDGIPDTASNAYGIGVNILDDGIAYIDFYKQYPLTEYPLPINYVLVKKNL